MNRGGISPVDQEDACHKEGHPHDRYISQRHIVWQVDISILSAMCAIRAEGTGVIQCEVTVVAIIHQCVSEVALLGKREIDSRTSISICHSLPKERNWDVGVSHTYKFILITAISSNNQKSQI